MFMLKDLRYKNILDLKGKLYFPPQQVICLVGESGSGKTTLLKLLNNLITADKGKVFYKEKDTTTLDPVQLRREVIMLQQAPIIFPGSVKENLLKGLFFAEKPLVEDARLLELLNSLNLQVELERSAADLSGGEKQRLALCRILLMKPEVLLLDEPTAALDEDTEELILKKVMDFTLQQRGTLIMVTHSKNIAYKHAHKIITLNEGKVTKTEEGVHKWRIS